MSQDHVVLSPSLGRHLIRGLLDRHPWPWTVEQDWTFEIYDRTHELVIKLPLNHPEAGELMEAASKIAKEDGLNREPLPCRDTHSYGPEADDLSEDMWEIIDPVCSVCGWRWSDSEARKNNVCGYTGEKNCWCKECSRTD